jgi:hypothetical protein
MIGTIYAAAWLFITVEGEGMTHSMAITQVPMPSMEKCEENLKSIQYSKLGVGAFCIPGEDRK